MLARESLAIPHSIALEFVLHKIPQDCGPSVRKKIDQFLWQISPQIKKNASSDEAEILLRQLPCGYVFLFAARPWFV